MKELIKKQHEECRKAYEGLSDKTSAAALQLLGAMGAYEELCPELKVSDSERIRKELIEYIKDQQSSFISAPDCRDKSEEEENQKYNSWISWLEKQGKTSPVLSNSSNIGKIERKPAEWSEEDSKNIKECVIAVSMSEGHTLEEKEQLEDWIKKRLSQKQCNYNPYKVVVESIAKMCKHYDNMDVGSLQDFYDNVKVKCKDAKEYDSLFPQSTWKPTAAQMYALKEKVNEGIYSGRCSELSSLYHDLIKLL